MTYNYSTTIFRSIFAQNVQISGRKIEISIFAYDFFKVKLKIVNKSRNTQYLSQNTSKYCSRIIVGHVHANGFL